MSKLYDHYIEEYEAAIAAGLEKGDTYVVIPEVWVASKWSQDNNISPFDPTFIEKLKLLGQLDMRLAATVAKGTAIMMESIKAQGKGD